MPVILYIESIHDDSFLVSCLKNSIVLFGIKQLKYLLINYILKTKHKSICQVNIYRVGQK